MTLGQVQYYKQLERKQNRDLSCLGQTQPSKGNDWLDSIVIVILIIMVAYFIGRDTMPRMFKSK